jgi:hypothetical protein
MNETPETSGPETGDDRIDADVLAEYLKFTEANRGLVCSDLARGKAGPEAAIEVFARHLIDELSRQAAQYAWDDGYGNTDPEEIARWHRQ